MQYFEQLEQNQFDRIYIHAKGGRNLFNEPNSHVCFWGLYYKCFSPVAATEYSINPSWQSISLSEYSINLSEYSINLSGYSISLSGYSISPSGQSIDLSGHSISPSDLIINPSGHIISLSEQSINRSADINKNYMNRLCESVINHQHAVI